MATVQDNMVVSLEYTLRLANNEVIDSSEGREPLTFIQGLGQIIPGLERALEGMAVGEEKDVVVLPEDGYGEENPDLFEELPRAIFPPDVEVGEAYRMHTENGASVTVFVEEVNDDSVLVNLNHPLAGQTLYFHVKIAGLREATEEELAEGLLGEDEDEEGCSCGCEGCNGC
ncbi:MAG: peptidylprolyl isomerase [Chloroflexi bacterium]|nr:peptidylprolyl isomerase [Chloroflexota bacterium]